MRDRGKLHGLIAANAGKLRLETFAAASMNEEWRQTKFPAPATFPVPHAERYWVQTESFGGEVIFESS